MSKPGTEQDRETPGEAADGSWRQVDGNKGVPFLYKLKESERWALLDDGRVMVIHPDWPPKILIPGRARGGDRCVAGEVKWHFTE